MGYTTDRNRLRRERVEQLVRKGFSNAELYGQGHSPTVVASVRKETGVPDPGDLLTHSEVRRARGFGPIKSLSPVRRKCERWEERWSHGED